MIYFDNSATTKPFDESIKRQNEIAQHLFYNCSTLYTGGRQANKTLENARATLANALSCKINEVFFTSSGTISDNIAIFGGAKIKNGKILCSGVEHAAVYNCFVELKNKGYNVEFIKSDKNGAVDIEHLKSVLTKDTNFVSIMHVNNITGTINDIKEISKIIRSYNKNCIIHSDGVQAFCKIDCDVSSLGVDIYSISSHKINGPKGAAALYKKKNLNLSPFILGGGQEKDVFPSTENLPAICGFETAVLKHQKDFAKNKAHLKELKKYTIEKIKQIDNVYILNEGDFAPHILNVSIKDVRAEVLQQYLSSVDIFIAIGSACNKNANAKSVRFLEPLKLPKSYTDGNIRISFSFENTKAEIDAFFEELKKAVCSLRNIKG